MPCLPFYDHIRFLVENGTTFSNHVSMMLGELGSNCCQVYKLKLLRFRRPNKFLFFFQITLTSKLIKDIKILKMNLLLDKAGNYTVYLAVSVTWTCDRISCSLKKDTKGLFTWREEDPSTRKILEGGTTFHLVYMQKFRPRCLPSREGKEEKLSPLSC